MTPHTLATTHVRTADGFKVFEVDTKKSTYFGISWKDLGAYGRKKFENLVILKNSEDRIKVLYV